MPPQHTPRKVHRPMRLRLPARAARVALPAGAVHPDRRRARARGREPDADLPHLGARRHPDRGADGPATEELAARSGPGIGGLLNVTFGNAPELIIALFALAPGPARGRQGVADRLDPRQHPARPRRRDVRRRPRPRPPVLRPHRRARRSRRCCCSPPRRSPCRRSSSSSRAAALPQPGARDRQLRLEGRDLSLAGRARADDLLRRRRCFLAARPTATSSTRRTREDDHEERAVDACASRSSRSRSPASPSASCPRSSSARSPRPRRAIGLSEFFIGVIVVAIVGNAAEHWVAVSSRARTRWTSR